MNYKICIMLCFAMFSVVSCVKRPADDGVIRETGEYALQGTDHKLNAFTTKDGYITFTIVNSDEENVFVNKHNVSAYHKWFFYWDQQARQLWFSSSDVGDFVFEVDERGKVKELNSNDVAMPDVIWNNLPSSLRKLLKQKPERS